MTSLKRSWDSLNPSQSSTDYEYPPSSQNSSVLPHDLGILESSTDASARNWNHVWGEVIGYPSNNSSDTADGVEDSSGGLFFPSIDNVQNNIESWLVKDFEGSPFDEVDDSFQEPADADVYRQAGFDICYGMIYRAKAKLDGDMSEVSRKLREDVPQARTHFILDIICLNEDLFITLPNGIRIARLNDHLTEALIDHVRSQSIRMEALVHRRSIFEDIAAATRAKDAHTTLNINVYGARDMQTSIGRDFSDNKIWLQRPDWVSPSTTYDNPHTLKFDLDIDQKGPEILSQVEQVSSNVDFRDSVDEIYSMLTRDSQLKGLAGDARLRTPLLSHQAKALDFMIQREIGPIPVEFHLWEPTSVESETWYRHKITGIKSRTLPSEVGGGVLADEMGMGKTFCVLALLVRTLEQAIAWSNDPVVHLAEGISPTKLLSRATLVVVPSPLLLTAWQKEIEDRLDLPLKILVHHGSERPHDAKGMVDYDIVLTTYHTLIADYNRSRPAATEVAWYRVVLDEAHFIRRTSTSLHKRAAELDAKFRWCLTGTPIQNTLEDIGALFAFVKILPFDRLGVFRKFISGPFSEGGTQKFDGQRNLVKLFDAICIRRMKDQLNLAGSMEVIHNIELSREERIQYNKTKDDMKRALYNLAGASESRNRFSMFQAQLQLRLLCNHGTFQHQFHWAKSRNTRDAREDALTAAGLDGEVVCSGCAQTVPGVLSNRAFGLSDTCAHVLCSECKDGSSDACPLCEATITQSRRLTSVKPNSSSHRGYFRSEGHSSKMAALVQDLLADAADDKSIVFTCWTTTLDLVGRHLKQHGIQFLRIDGEHSSEYRQNVLDRFQTDPCIPVLIMTTGVGAFGLNIIAANRVFLVEPQWNPSVEAQAIGRTIRIGQHKAVKVTRYVVRSTVEEDIQHLQRRKRGIAKMTSKTTEVVDMKVKQEYNSGFR